jgi:hypothetical protein
MRFRLMLVLVLLAASGCSTSGAVFERPSIDAGMPDPTPTPMPVIPIAPGQCAQTDSKPHTVLDWAPVGRPFEYTFPVACTGTARALAVPLTIVGPDNQQLQGTVPVSTTPDGGPNQLMGSVRFVPTQPGPHTFKWTDRTEPDLWLEVTTEQVSPPRIVREFSDRMDLCTNGIFLTPSGLTVCVPETSSVRIYDTRGELVETFPAWPSTVAVVGDTTWSSVEFGSIARVEARRFSDAGVSLVGSLELPPFTEPQGAITETTFERGFVRLTITDGGFERSTVWPAFQTSNQFALIDGTNVLTRPGCRARPGCSTTPLECPPVLTCFAPNSRVEMRYLAWTADALWLYVSVFQQSGRILMFPRPVDTSLMVIPEESGVFLDGRDFWRSASRVVSEPPYIVQRENTQETVILPVRRGNSVRFSRVTTKGRVVAVTQHAVAAQLADPFRVEFVLLPPSL